MTVAATILAAAVVVSVGLAGAPRARASCVDSVQFKAGQAKPVQYRLPDRDNDSSQAIVGLWHVIYTADEAVNFPPGAPPTPFQFLESFKMWHADGLEFESAFLPPAGGNICFGVWKDLGNRTVKLHHVGLMFNPATGAVSNTFTVDEVDTVAEDGKSYSGRFIFRLFAASDVYGNGVPLGEVKGTTAATRITVQ
ncbi:MAG: hypothetical protein ACRD1L_04000 [Terriglobales bacterium]